MEKRFSDLKKIDGHKNYYRSEKSGIIYFKNAKLGKISTKENTIGKAKAFIERKTLEINSGKSSQQIDRQIRNIINPPIQQIYFELVEKKKHESAKGTINNYMKSWRMSMMPFWGNKNTIDLNDHNIMQFKLWYLENRPKKHVEKAVIHFKVLVDYCIKNGFIKIKPDLSVLDNLHEIVEKNAKREVVGRVLSDYEITTLLNAAQSLPKPYLASRAYLAILLGAKCGLRKMEAMSLEWLKISLDRNEMVVWSMKNKKWRTVPFVNQIKEAFTFQKQFCNESKFVFPMPSNSQKYITGQVLDKVWVDTKSKANLIVRTRFHDLRHTCATHTAEKGWPPIVACRMLDMSLDVYSKVYAKPSDAVLKAMMMKDFSNEL